MYNCTPGCVPEFPINWITQAINDALSLRIEELDSYTESAEASANSASASATSATQAAQLALGYRDQSQQIFNSAQQLVPKITEATVIMTETFAALTALADSVSGLITTNFYYTVVGGETTVVVPEQYKPTNIRAIYIEGSRQDTGYGYTYNRDTRTITFAEAIPVEAVGTVILIQVGSLDADTPEALANQLNSNSGASMIGTESGSNVQTELNGLSEDISNLESSVNTKLDAKANSASPVFTGNPTAPTPAVASNDKSVATTAFVQAVVAALVASAPGTLDTLKELADALGDDPNFATTMANALSTKAPLNNPALTGTPTAPTAPTATNNTQLANTAFVQAVISALKGNAPTALDTLAELAAAINNDANFASTVATGLASKAPLDSPSFTGKVVLPGIVDGTAAATGKVGEVLTNTVSATNIPTATPVNACTLTLTPGEWEVQGMVDFETTNASFTLLQSGIGSSSAAVPAFPFRMQLLASFAANAQIPSGIRRRFVVTANTPIYLVAQAYFASGSATVNGYLEARRIR